MDHALIESTAVAGVTPPRQARSRKVVADLVAATLEMLDGRDFATLSIAEVCERAGVTTGAFYKRFPSKDVFVEFVQRLVVAEMRERIESTLTVERFGTLPLRDLLRRTVGGTVRWYRGHAGFVRASLRNAQQHPERWSPMRETGARYIGALEPIVLRIVDRPGDARVAGQFRFALQMTIGLLNSMVLIDPGPYRLDDDRIVAMLVDTVARAVEAAATEQG